MKISKIVEKLVNGLKSSPRKKRALLKKILNTRIYKILQFEGRTWLVTRYLTDPDIVTIDVINTIFSINDPHILARFATNPNLSKDILLRLAKYPHGAVQASVIFNKNFTPEILLESGLLNSESYFVRKEIQRYLQKVQIPPLFLIHCLSKSSKFD